MMTPNEIRAELIRRNITVTSIAKQLGLKQPNVSAVIRGGRRTPKVRKAIADAIGKSVSEIWPVQESSPNSRNAAGRSSATKEAL